MLYSRWKTCAAWGVWCAEQPWPVHKHRLNGLNNSGIWSKDMIWCDHGVASGGHVAGFSWPFDRPRGRPRSGEPRSFFEKTLLLFGNQPAIQSPSQDILQETPQIFLKSTRSPERMPSGFFAKKPLPFPKIDPCSTNALTIFYENLLEFFSNQHTIQLWLYLFFSKKRLVSAPRAWARPKD